MLRPLIPSLAAALLLTSACKTPDPSTTETHHKQVKDLTPSERRVFDKTITQTLHNTLFSDEMQLRFCTMSSVWLIGGQLDKSESELQSECITKRDECITDANAQRKEMASTPLPIPDNCSVTVAEFEACLHQKMAHHKEFSTQFSPCESQTLASFKTAADQYPPDALLNHSQNESPLPACQPVRQKCPTHGI